ncbi:MAG: HAMP domain-containing histidine kinase, partial [Bacteroidetes bacterium]|nr:HAMP domain-containing histidine kinase [Bacteroidota bacterium]
NSLIKKELATKGLFVPFEFLLKKEDKQTDKVLAKSKNYIPTHKFYKTDLSNDKIFSNHNYLYLQFPDEAGYVFSAMKNMLILTALFSLVIIVVFYITIQSVLRQKKLNEVKNDFINNMTHELKTPIATISLAIDALNNPQVKHDEERFSKYTSILKEENQKLNNHVEDVLQLALLEKGELQLHRQKINVIEVIKTSINTHKLQIAKQNAQLIFVPQESQIMIMADEFHLLAVFNNLIDNALKYSNQYCVIELSIYQTTDNIAISIKDNGIGISPDLHKKVFEKFYRVQSGNLHDVKGFGLGLSYVKSIIEQHGGSIELRSNNGSEFIIKLPMT